MRLESLGGSREWNAGPDSSADLSRKGAPYKSAVHEERFFLILAVFIGIFSGLAVVCFRVAIDWSRLALLGSALVPPVSRELTVPAVVGLIVAALVMWFFPRARGSGVNQTKAALYIYNG